MIDPVAAPSMTDPPPADAPFHCPSDLDLFRSYQQIGNIWKVGALFGIKGSTVHNRIKRTGLYKSRPPEFTAAQIERLKEYYQSTPVLEFDLKKLARELGKSHHNVSRKARHLGLSNRTRPSSAQTRAKGKAPKWADKPHPRGMAGKKHSSETLKIVSASSKRNWATWKAFGIGQMSPEARENRSEKSRTRMSKRPASANYTRTKGGYRSDLGDIYFRSSWEANYARYLNLLIKFKVVQSWEFEPETFWFEDIKRGVTSYLVDFKVYYTGEESPTYVEVKGWMDPRSKTKISRFHKYYPQHRLEIVGAKEYRAIAAKWSSSIPHWESSKPMVCVTVRRA